MQWLLWHVTKSFEDKKKLRSSSMCQNIEFSFHLPKYWGRFPFTKIISLSSISPNIWVVFQWQKYWGRLPFAKDWGPLQFAKDLDFNFPKNWGHLPFMKKLRSYSIVEKKNRSSSISFWENSNRKKHWLSYYFIYFILLFRLIIVPILGIALG